MKLLDKISAPLLLLGALLITTAFILNFTTAPLVLGASVDTPALIGGQVVTNKLLLSQKIFYFHMPVAVVSLVTLLFTAVYCILFLVKRDHRYDVRAKVATEISLVFIIMTMVTGVLWTRYEWGVWWTWDPRLTTYFILTLMVIGYFVLRNSIDDPERRATYAAVFGIVTAINAPISFMITRLVPTSIHPVIIRSDSGLLPSMILPLMLAMVGFAFIAFALYRLRVREQDLRVRLEALKEAYDE